MSRSSTPRLQGWLMKQNHGLNKSWQRRYFVLEGRQLSYYRSEMDTIPQTVLDLDHYTILTDVVPLNSLKRETPKNNTFMLMSDDQNSQNDYFLQAESERDMACWIDSLQQQVNESPTSVLDKWLEWVDIHTCPLPPPSSSSSASSPSLLLSPKNRPLRSHRSAESISSSTGSVSSTASFSTAASDCHNDRRPSNQSTTSVNSSGSCPASKFFSSRLFSRCKTKRSPPPALNTLAPQTSFSVRSLSPQPSMNAYSSTVPLISPIIHPSEYNRDNDDDELLHRFEKIQTNANDHAARLPY